MVMLRLAFRLLFCDKPQFSTDALVERVFAARQPDEACDLAVGFVGLFHAPNCSPRLVRDVGADRTTSLTVGVVARGLSPTGTSRTAG